VVDTTVDDGDLDECTDAPDDCSLRGAFEGFAENQDMSVVTDITVPAGTYALTDELHVHALNVNVHGAGVGETIVTVDHDAEEDSLIRHIYLHTDGDITVTLSDMTFRDGNGDQEQAVGGSILAEGGAHLTLERMHFVENEIRGDGGAIAFYGNPSNFTLIVDDTTFADNHATERGGAIHLSAGETAEITNSTFTGNTAAAGGALFVGDENGSPAEATLTHVTLADNGSAGVQGDAATSGGAIGVGDAGEVTLEGTLIERSVEAEGGIQPVAVGDPAANCAVLDGGDIVSAGHNVVDDDTCELDQDTDQPETAAGTAALADNGGPTFTMAIAAGSPATDTGGDTCAVDDDQRGIDRPQDGNADDTVACDVGAYEREADEPEPEPPAAQPAEVTPDFTG
jgi:predicted outer membrane repeat protein